MRRKLLSVLLAVLLLLVGCSEREQNNVRAEPQGPAGVEAGDPPPCLPPSVAGSFYPSDAGALRADVERYLKSAAPPRIEGEIIAVIVPHAGYVYSGPVAAYAYKAIGEQLEGNEGDMKPDAVVVLAFSHRIEYPAVSVYYRGAMETPLGRQSVNERIAREFMDSGPRLKFSQRVFAGEHSAEVQIPFIQVVLPDVPVVPVIFGQQSLENVEAVSKGLEEIARGNRILIVATTDLSHYNPYERAIVLDGDTVKWILKGDPRELAQHLSKHNDRMCGPGPVLAVLSYAESQGAVPVLLKYANSGDTSGSRQAVVGYAALAFVKKKKSDAETGGSDASAVSRQELNESSRDYLTEHDKEALLRIARLSLESFVRDRKFPAVDPPESERLRQDGAGFVTLMKNGKLRGCMGQMKASIPLYQTVIQMAVAAASRDPRFRPVEEGELDDIHIEISVNTPLRAVSGPEEIVLGRHGVVVAKGLRQGVFLPQVATDTGWSKEEFLENLCVHKAGLAPDAYKKDARLYVFTSIVFEEHF